MSSNNEYLSKVLAVRVHSIKEINIVTLQLSFRLQYHHRLKEIVLGQNDRDTEQWLQ